MNQSILALLMSLSLASPVTAGKHSIEVQEYAVVNMSALLSGGDHEGKGRFVGCMFSKGYMQGLNSPKTVEEVQSNPEHVAPLVLDAMVDCYTLAVSK